MNVDPTQTAIIVVDMQNCFAHEDGALYAPPSGDVIGDIQEFVESAPEEVTVVYTRDTHTQEQFEENDNYDEFDRWGEHAVDGTWGHHIVEGLSTMESDVIIDKPTYDAFHNTELDAILQENNINNVLVCGTLANVCVLHTASSAALNDYRATVLEDLVGYIEEDDKEYALDHTEWLFGSVEPAQNIEF